MMPQMPQMQQMPQMPQQQMLMPQQMMMQQQMMMMQAPGVGVLPKAGAMPPPPGVATSTGAVAEAPTDQLRRAAQHQKRASKEKEHKETTVFVGGLRKTTDEDKVIGHFSKYGAVESVDVKRLPDGTSRGFAFVKFKDKESVQKVVEARANHMIDNKWVAVTPHGNQYALGTATSDRGGGTPVSSRNKEPQIEEEEDVVDREDFEGKWSENYLKVAAQVAQKQKEEEGEGDSTATTTPGDATTPMMGMMMPNGMAMMPVGMMPVNGQMQVMMMPMCQMGQMGQMPMGQMGQMPMGQMGQMPMGQMPMAQMSPMGAMPMAQMSPMGAMPMGVMPQNSQMNPMASMPMGAAPQNVQATQMPQMQLNSQTTAATQMGQTLPMGQMGQMCSMAPMAPMGQMAMPNMMGMCQPGMMGMAMPGMPAPVANCSVNMPVLPAVTGNPGSESVMAAIKNTPESVRSNPY